MISHSSKDKISSSEILNNTETYTIEDITETTAKLKTPTNDYLDLTKV